MANQWSEDEVEILISKYSHYSNAELTKHLPERNEKAINVKATKLKLRKSAETLKRIREQFGDNQRGEANPMFGRKKELHHRYKGGYRKVACSLCGKETEYRNSHYEEIQNGKRTPACSTECSTAFARQHIVSERTSIEIKMAEELTRRQIEYTEQHNLGNKFALDFFLPEYGIVIECDGDYWHRLPNVARRDKSKNAYIKACGYSLYRFWESEINTDVEACVDVVIAEINDKEVI